MRLSLISGEFITPRSGSGVENAGRKPVEADERLLVGVRTPITDEVRSYKARIAHECHGSWLIMRRPYQLWANKSKIKPSVIHNRG